MQHNKRHADSASVMVTGIIKYLTYMWCELSSCACNKQTAMPNNWKFWGTNL